MMHLFRLTAVAAALAFAAPAIAAPVLGGTTVVRVTSAPVLTGQFGLTLANTGTATVAASPTAGVPDVFFPITGGDLNFSTLAGTIRHEGSGVRLSAGGNTLDVGNFIIDTVNSQILGDVSLNGTVLASDAQIFTFSLTGLTAAQITNLGDPRIPLLVSSTAAGVLTQAFGAPNLAGVQFGLAATTPQATAVPEPASWAMMIGGFALLGGAMRVRRGHGAVAA